jgi:glycosyltransferase involved in cell wall biosynthesis
MSDRSRIAISLVVPVFREGRLLPQLVSVVGKEMEVLREEYEVILVDDGSTDNSWELISEASRRDPRVRGLRLSRNFGKEAALCAGLDAAVGQVIITMDADLQHPPSLIPEMVRIWRSGEASIVEAVKRERLDEPFWVKARRRAYWVAMRRLSGFDLRQASDFKLIDSDVRSAWLRMGENSLFYRGMIAWLGFKRVQIEFDVPERIFERSHWSFLGLVRLGVISLTAFSNLPLRLAGLVGVLFFVFAVILGVYAVVLKLNGGAATGFTTVIVLQLIIGSGMFFSFAILGEYIARIYAEVKNRPRYVVSATTSPETEDGSGSGDDDRPAQSS